MWHDYSYVTHMRLLIWVIIWTYSYEYHSYETYESYEYRSYEYRSYETYKSYETTHMSVIESCQSHMSSHVSYEHDSYETTHMSHMSDTHMWHDYSNATWLTHHKCIHATCFIHVCDITQLTEFAHIWHGLNFILHTSESCHIWISRIYVTWLTRTYVTWLTRTYVTWLTRTYATWLTRTSETWLTRTYVSWLTCMLHKSESCHIWISRVTYEWESCVTNF